MNATNTSSKAALTSPQRKQWEGAIDKEVKILDDHEVYNLVLITRVPRTMMIIGSHVVFNQGPFKARLLY